ncbi:MAG: flagellar hook-length control protein FliK [Deltaproteobacteria bacterium]|nr:flagellar hook-length control protein FliK [Deltaproteobacteria bacterium]
MEIRLFTATPAEVNQAVKDAEEGREAQDGSFEDLLAVAAENELVEDEAGQKDTIVETSLQGAGFGMKDMKPAEEIPQPVENETNDDALVIAAPVLQSAFQPMRQYAGVEEGVLTDADQKTGATVRSFDTEPAETSVPAFVSQTPEETVAGAKEEAKVSANDDVRDETATATHDNGAEVSGVAVNPNAAPYNDPAPVTDTAAFSPSSRVEPGDGVYMADTSRTAVAASEEKPVREDGAWESVEANEPSGNSGPESKTDDGVGASGATLEEKGAQEGGEEGGEHNGGGEEGASVVKAERRTSEGEGNGNEAFEVEYAPSTGASSNDQRQINGPLNHSGIATEAAFGPDLTIGSPARATDAVAGRAETHIDGLFEKLDTGVRMSVQGGKSVRLELSPEHLGEMEIRLKIEDAKVAAEIRVESAEVKALLDSDSGRLKEIFNSNGLTLDKYTVEVDMNPMRGKAEGNGYGGNWSQENSSNGNGYGRKPWTGEAEVEAAFGNRREASAKNGGIDIFA